MTVQTSEEIDLPIDLRAAEREWSPDRKRLENECVKVRLSEVEEILREKTPDNGTSKAKTQGITVEKYQPERLLGRLQKQQRRKRHQETLPSQEIVGIALRDACEIYGVTPKKRRCRQPIQSAAKDAFTFITPPNEKPYRRKDHRTKLKWNQSTKSVCKMCAIYMWWIFCVSKADAQLAAHTYRTSCEAKTSVFEGEQAFVQCQFPDDPRRYKFDFNVIRYDFDGMNPVGDIILNCIWNTNATCQLKDGYTFDQSAIDTNISVRIPSVRREHAGRYVCGYATARREEDKECSLSVKGLVINCSSPSPTIRVGDPSRITCHYNSDLSRTREDFYVYRFDHDKDAPVMVLHCKWDMGTAANFPTCTLEPGYSFNRTNISSTVTLEVPSAEQRHSGNYSCNVIPYSKQVQVKTCTLAVQGWQQDAPDPRPSRSQASQTYQPTLTVAMTACYLVTVDFRF